MRNRFLGKYSITCSIDFETGSVQTCKYTGEGLEITEDFPESVEARLLGAKANEDKRLAFRVDTQKEYTSKTLTQEMLDPKEIKNGDVND
jgi:hypothetical protein